MSASNASDSPPISPEEHFYRRQLEAVCNNATVSLFFMDEKQQCVYANPAAEMLTGYSLAEMRGRPLHDVIHHTRPDGTPYPLEECPIDRAFPENVQEQGEEVFVHKDGTFYPVAFTASPIRAGGAVVGTIIEVRGTADEKERETQMRELLRLEREAREEAQTLYEIGQILSAELDLKKIVQQVTDAATEVTGAQFGSFFYNLLDENGASYMLYTLSGVPRAKFENFPMPRATEMFGPTFRGEGIVRAADVRQDARFGKNHPHYGMPKGHLPVVSYLAVPVFARSGEVLGGLFFGHAKPGVFTERHERLVQGLAAQTAIAMDNARLFEQQQKAREAAETANRTKDEFLATLSHELRTPLNAILGWSRMIGEQSLEDADRHRGIAAIQRNAQLQAQLIEDLLDVSRIITGKLALQVRPIEIAPIIEAAVESVLPAAEAREIRLQRVLDSATGLVSGDPGRLQQVVWNLLSNAIKFTPKGGRVQIRLERVDSHLEIVVSDNGMGIKADVLPHVFDRFRQADSTSTRHHGGLGLGLAIVRHIVEMHGGTVEAHSDGQGQGATFTVKLPMMATRSAKHEQAERRRAAPSRELTQFDCPAELRGLRVLVVDDEEDARRLVCTVLELCEAQVTAAPNVAEALELIKNAPPDVLVSDLGMPDEDGYSLIRKVRALPPEQGGEVPAVALTAYARTEDRLQVLRAGFQVHLPKPIEPAELVAVVASLARIARR